MAVETETQAGGFARALKLLELLQQFAGPPRQFWPAYLEAMVLVAGGRAGIIVRRAPEDNGVWKKVCAWPADGFSDREARPFLATLETVAAACAQQGQALHKLNGGASRLASSFAIGIRVETSQPQDVVAALFWLDGLTDAEAGQSLQRLRLIADKTVIYELQRATNQARAAESQLASVLDLMVLLNAQKRFLATAMTFCNELASRLGCDRVSLGWQEHEYVKLQTMSHTEKFEKKMEAVKTLELAMEEALDQDEEILWPPVEGSTLISRDHAGYAQAQGAKFICSVPLRLEGKPVAVLTCERNTEAFSEQEVRLLRLCCDMAVRRLADLKRYDCWFGARLAAITREQLSKLVGVEHTWAKLLGILIAGALAVVVFGRMTYRVEAQFTLRADDIAFIQAPFNGFIGEVNKQVGDDVAKGEVLLTLDTRDLFLEEAAALADYHRYQREAEKATAEKAMADMRIAAALAEQARVKLEYTRHRLAQSAIRAPFAGVVIEGDLRDRIGAPVKQGDLLFKVARTDKMHVRCELNERDVDELRNDAVGEIAFASQPKLKFPVRVVRIEPAAQATEKGNVFIVRCAVEGALQDWWRPGMSGVARLYAGKRSILWVLTHRTVDYLRMWLWW